jgi:hypothetical protein
MAKDSAVVEERDPGLPVIDGRIKDLNRREPAVPVVCRTTQKDGTVRSEVFLRFCEEEDQITIFCASQRRPGAVFPR